MAGKTANAGVALVLLTVIAVCSFCGCCGKSNDVQISATNRGELPVTVLRSDGSIDAFIS
jgi:hypothetical protein